MFTSILLAVAGIVLWAFFIRPSPNTYVAAYRRRLAFQRVILAMANFALLPLTIFVGHLFYGIFQNGLTAETLNWAFSAMYGLWYVYVLAVILAVMLSYKLTESIGNQIDKMGNGENSIFKGAVLASEALQQDVVVMSQKLGIKNVPTLYILPADGPPNAFAIGVHDGHSAIAVHTSLVLGLTTDELHAVIAHELAHIAAGDMHLKILNMFIKAPYVFLLVGMFFAFSGFIPALLAVWGAHMVIKTLGALLDFAMSHRAEFNADAVAVDMLGSGAPMAKALQKLEAMLLVEAPVLMQKSKRTSRWLKTHPPLAERVDAVRRLRVK